jgi:hypothetical protein
MSKIEVDAIDKQSGSTLTLGGSGTAVTLACGATQSGFGRTGTVDWQTSIKTSTITAVNGEGYFVNTTGGAITANLPAGVVGAIVSFKDYAQTFDTNALTIAANGSEKIEGQTFDLKLNTEGLGVTLVYGDATKGWQAVNSNEIVNVQKFVTATGGTVTCSGDFKIHTFTGPGTFSVSCAGNAQGSDTVSYTVIAGGGGGGGSNAPPGSPYGAGGGGGAGGFRESKSPVDSYTASPLATTAGLPVNSQSYPITVGAAGSAGPAFDRGGNGNSSTFSTITAAGGGGGGSRNIPTGPGLNGGSGGGGGSSQPSPAPSPTNAGGLGNTPSTTPAQGFPGGVGSNAPYCANGANAGGGGGATAVGVALIEVVAPAPPLPPLA